MAIRMHMTYSLLKKKKGVQSKDKYVYIGKIAASNQAQRLREKGFSVKLEPMYAMRYFTINDPRRKRKR